MESNQGFQVPNTIPQNTPPAPDTNPVQPPHVVQSTDINPEPKKKGSVFRTLLVIASLIFINPIGIILMFAISRWKKWVKILILVLLIPFYAFWIFTIVNIITKFKQDAVLSDAEDKCAISCAQKAASDPTTIPQQCKDDCLKTNLDPKIYQLYQSSLKK